MTASDLLNKLHDRARDLDNAAAEIEVRRAVLKTVAIELSNAIDAECHHADVSISASTGAESNGTNLTVGVTMRCTECDRVWTGDVVVGISRATLTRMASMKEVLGES